MQESNIASLESLLVSWRGTLDVIRAVKQLNFDLGGTLQAVGTEACGESLAVDLSSLYSVREQLAEAMVAVYERDAEKILRGEQA